MAVIGTGINAYERVEANLWDHIAHGAGVVVKGFDPSDGSFTAIMGATDGGFNFNPNPEFYDLGEGIDNIPANTKELKRVRGYNPQISGTFKSVTPALAKSLQAAGIIDEDDAAHIIPSHDLQDSDFEEITVVTNYSKVDSGDAPGFAAVTLHNALNLTGFQMQTQNQDKGQFAFEYHGHYSLADLSKVPFDIYVKAGTAPTEETTETTPETTETNP